jgi:hypothetical protein
MFDDCIGLLRHLTGGWVDIHKKLSKRLKPFCKGVRDKDHAACAMCNPGMVSGMRVKSF